MELNCGLGVSDRHKGCAHSWEDWEAIEVAQPLHRKLPSIVKLKWHHWVKNPYDATIGRAISTAHRRFRLLRHGYDPNEWWQHYYAVSRIAIKHLEDLRDKGHGIKSTGNAHIQGVSLDGEGRDEWKAMLDDMIFFHRIAADEYEPRTITYTPGFGKRKGQPTSFERSPEFGDLTKDEQARYRRGKFFYFKYFEQLWD